MVPKIVPEHLRNRSESGVAGVFRKGKKWKVAFRDNGKLIDLGLFDRLHVAINARLEYEQEKNGGK